MALVESEHFHEFLARLQNDSGDPTKGQVLGMHVQKRRVIVDDQTGVIRSSTVLPAVSVGWAGLALLMNDTDLAALKAAVDAETASRV